MENIKSSGICLRYTIRKHSIMIYNKMTMRKRNKHAISENKFRKERFEFNFLELMSTLLLQIRVNKYTMWNEMKEN